MEVLLKEKWELVIFLKDNGMKNKKLVYGLILVIFAIHGCTDPVSYTSTISLEMEEIIPQSGTSVSVKGKISTDFGVVYGFCYSQSHNPTINDKVVMKSTWDTSGKYSGYLTADIDQLSPNETYYFRLYAKDYNRTCYYSNEMSFTPERVVVTTGSASNVSFSSVTLNASVSCPGNTSISQRGFEYGQGSLNRNWNESSKSTGSYSTSISYLTSATTYYYRAYVIDNYGNKVYGDTKSFTTKDYNDAITISEFKNMSVGGIYYNLRGVIWNVVNSTNGYFYLVDETGIIPVMGLESFSSLGLSRGDNITIRAQRQTSYVPYAGNATLVRQNASWVNLSYTYAIEPTATQSFNNSYSDFSISKDNLDNWYRLVLFNGTQQITLRFICDYNSASVIPAGTYNISSSYSKGTIAYSPGFDLNKGVIYNSVFYNNYASSDFPQQEFYCLTGGYVKVTVSGSSVTLTIRATTYNGSIVNASWTGDLTTKYSQTPSREDERIVYPIDVACTE